MSELNASSDSRSSLTSGDDPILSSEGDLLNRSRLASAISDEIQAMNVDRGAVVAITGKWGTGKTSLLNLTANILRDQEAVQVIEFNPWFFSGTDHLIRFFFDEMARQLKASKTRKGKIKDAAAGIADKFNRYSASLSPLKFVPGVGGLLEAAQKTSEGVSQALTASIYEQREEIFEALGRFEGRIVVLVDDIDRLTRQEVRDLFRLVRLSGSFPNVVYVLCFDRGVVERALGEEGLDGAAYLEKIVKTSVEVPPAADEALASVLRDGMSEVLAGIDVFGLDDGRFPDVFWQVVRPLFATVRDVKRFLASLSLTARAAGEEVCIPDLVALEAIRVMRPAAHDLIASNVEPLTQIHGWSAGSRDQGLLSAHAQAITEIQQALSGGVERALIELIFPAAQVHTGNVWHGNDSRQLWRRGRRVAHTEVLKYYLHRELPSGAVSSNQVDLIVSATGNEGDLSNELAAIPDQLLEDALDRFLAHVGDVADEAIPGVAVALLKLFPRFSEDPSGMFDFGRDYTALRPVRRLMERVDRQDVDSVARTIYEATESPYARLRFVSLIGKLGEGNGQLISAELEEALRVDLREFIKSAPADALRSERGLLSVVVQCIDCSPESGSLAIDSAATDEVTARLLETALSVSQSNSMGSVVVRSEDRLAWDPLVSVYGGEARLAEAVQSLRDSMDGQQVTERLQRALVVYDRYNSGWRPPAF
ncbi:P-loop NTPase fold protein [Streptomyces zaomyceticus]|uniref:KAP family P-loop NTPase fold protein n=1 Tax=Streptomyces zaomyceticus TaxID=68286 RepID=UPI0037104AC2